ncbi:MAG: hypothetical protein JJU00_08180 [Opitutales bacterium]|nr:hypothetical protein [Opitutales bacterium]
MHPSWRQLPPRPPPGALDPLCLPDAAAVWTRLGACFNRPPKLYRKTFRPADDGGLHIRSSEGWEMRILPWPETGIVCPDEQRHDLADRFAYDGCVLPRALTAALSRKDDPAATGGILGELGLDEEGADALRAFNERFPPDVLDTVFRWRFRTGHYAVAAACALPGFTTLLDAHPQLAFLTAAHILARTAGQPLRPSTWEPILNAGPRPIASGIFGLPDRNTTLEVLRRLHFDCLAGDEAPCKDFLTAFNRRRAFETLISLEAPVSPWVLRLLAAEPAPHPALVRRANGYQRRDGNDHVASVIFMHYRFLSARLKDTADGGALAALSRIRSPDSLQREFRRPPAVRAIS